MIIDSLHIYSFGKLKDFHLEFHKGINLIEGKNEAGKSTIMAFINAILFGFESRRIPHLRYEPLQGGQLGGVINIKDENDDVYRIERIFHKKISGDVTVYLPNGEKKGEEYLKRFLGNVNDKVYKQIFSISLSELQQIENLQEDKINDFIYHAGTGSVDQILQMDQHIDQEKQRLFKIGGKNPDINELLKELDEIKEEIGQLKEHNDAYQGVAEELEYLETNIVDIEKKRERDQQQLVKSEKIDQFYDKYQQIKFKKEELKKYPDDFQFPSNGIERLEHILEKLDHAAIDRQQLIEKRNELQQRIKSMDYQPVYIENQTLIEDLREELNDFRHNKDKRNQLINEIHSLEGSINDKLIQLGSDFSKEKLAKIEISMQDKQKLHELMSEKEHWQENMNEVKKQMEIKKDRQTRLNKLIAKQKNEIDQLQEEIGVQTNLHKTSDKTQNKLMYLVGGFIWLIIISLLYFLNQKTVAIFFTSLGFVFFALRFFIPNTSLKDSKDKGNQRELKQLLYIEKKENIKGLTEELQEINKEIDDLETNKLEPFLLEANRWEKGWEDWLETHYLSKDISNTFIFDMIALIQRTKELVNQQRLVVAEKNEVEKRMEAFKNKWQNFIEKNHLMTHGPIEEQIIRVSDNLKRNIDAKNQIGLLQDNVEQINEQISKMDKLIENENEKRDKLYQYGNVTGKEAFYSEADRYKYYLRQREELESLEKSLESTCETNEEYQNFLEQLRRANQTDLRLKLYNLKHEIEESSTRLKELLQKKGKLQNKIEQMEQDDRLSDLNQKYNILKSALKEKVKEWSIYTFSQHVLMKTMEIYETEKQPDVMRRTSYYFNKLSGNSYSQVIAPIGKKTIEVIRNDGLRITPQFLSRGTREQLYLAIRLALIEEYTKYKHLPIILDDVFVNFDNKRLNYALSILMEMSEVNQIILFTCHNYISKNILDITADLNKINLEAALTTVS